MKTYIIYAYYTTAVPPLVPGAVSKVRFEVGIVQSTNALLATKSLHQVSSRALFFIIRDVTGTPY